MNTKLNRFLAVALGVWLVGTSMKASALNTATVTPAEMAQLPRYCLDAQSFNAGFDGRITSPSAVKWVGMMGNSFIHIHHYCWALVNIRRAERANFPSQTKQALRSEARGDLLYVINNSPKDFILLPEIYTWLGRIDLSRNDPRNAEQAFSKARELKPDYWPAYSYWAQYLADKGQRAEALKVATAGLQQSPNARALIDVYKSVGGKPADLPKPVAREPREALPSAEAEAAPPKPSEPGPRNDQSSSASPVAK